MNSTPTFSFHLPNSKELLPTYLPFLKLVFCFDLVTISVTKDGIKFEAEGELANGSVSLKAGGSSIDEDEEDTGVVINMNQATSCILSLKYLQNFTKATPLSSRVHLGLSSDVPVLTEYKVENVGYIRYYLAPKMDEEE
jgi:proliferating cell nuclear antigen